MVSVMMMKRKRRWWWGPWIRWCYSGDGEVEYVIVVKEVWRLWWCRPM